MGFRPRPPMPRYFIQLFQGTLEDIDLSLYPEKSYQKGFQEASEDAQAPSSGSSHCKGAAALFRSLTKGGFHLISIVTINDNPLLDNHPQPRFCVQWTFGASKHV